MSLADTRTRLLEDTTLTGRAFSEAWTKAVDDWLTDRFVAATESPDRAGMALVAVGA